MRTHPLLFGILVALTLLLFCPAPAAADWPDSGLPVCNAPNDQLQIAGCPDGAGGMILVWRDLRPTGAGIHAQRVSAAGEVLWATNGVRLSPAGFGGRDPAIASDDRGGAWVVWEDQGNPFGAIYLQRLDASGTPVFAPAGGSPLVSGTDWFEARRPSCAPDGSGGVIVAFTEELGPSARQVVAQRVGADGTILWDPAGVLVGADIQGEATIAMAVHDVDGTLLGWVDSSNFGIAQWVDLAGTPRWNSTSGHSVGLVVAGSRVKVATRERFDHGAHILYQRAHSFAGQTYFEWRIQAVADNQYEWWDEDLGESTHTGPDANISRAEFGGCVAAWYSVDPASQEISVWAKRFEGDGDLAWEQLLGQRPVAFQGAAPAVSWAPFDYFGYRFAWPALDDGTPRLFFRSMGRNGEAVPDPGPGILTATYSTATPILVPGSTSSSITLVAWRDERRVSETDVYATAFEADGDLPHADLVPRSLTVTPDPAIVGSPPHLRAVVVNQGAIEAGSFHIGYWRNTATPGGSPDFSFAVSAGLAPQDSVVVDFDETAAALLPLTWTMWLRADSQDEVSEGSAESNNDLQRSLDWVALPNLEISAFAIDPPHPVLTDSVRYQMTVSNTGLSDAGPFVLRLYHDRSSAPSIADPGDEEFVYAGLASGASITTSSAAVATDVPAVWRSYALVDATGAVAESHEDDNVAGPLSVAFVPPENEGWPVDAGTSFLHSPVVASFPLTPPGLRAVLVTSADGVCYAWDGRGRSLSGWPYTNLSPIQASPAAGDLDADGTPEVVFGDDAGRLLCLDASGTPLWSFRAAAAITATPAIGNVLGGSGTGLEVVFGDAAGNVYALDAQGQLLSGWPQDLGQQITTSPALGDIDGSGTSEIVVVAGIKTGSSRVYVLRADGQSLGPMWPVTIAADVAADPALGDLVGTSGLDVLVGDLSGGLHMLPGNGLSLPVQVDLGAPVVGALTVADFDRKGSGLELVAQTDVYVPIPPIGGFWRTVIWALDGTGTARPGWPVATPTHLVDNRAGDGVIVWNEGADLRVAVGTERQDCAVFDAGGNLLAGYEMPGEGIVTGSLAAADLDGDRRLEVVVAGTGRVHCYELGPDSYRPEWLQWSQFGHDAQRTHCYGPETVTGLDSPAGAVRVSRWHSPRPNPFNPRVQLAFELARAGKTRVEVYDLAGHRVTTLLDAKLETGPHQVTWDGRDREGARVASGVYLIRLDAPDVRTTTRAVLLK